MKITKTVTSAPHKGGISYFYKNYLSKDGLSLEQIKETQGEIDFQEPPLKRISHDNGKTYGEWVQCTHQDSITFYGEDEYWKLPGKKIWNPVHNHYVSNGMMRYSIQGHVKAYDSYWGEGNGIKNGVPQGFFDHQHLAVISEDDKVLSNEMIKYEEGKEFDPENTRDKDFLLKNIGYASGGEDCIVLNNGDILVCVSAWLTTACDMLGLSKDEYANVKGEIHNDGRAIIVAKGKFNKENNKYDFTFSKPLLTKNTLTSRGFEEPMLIELKSGKILLVMRASNMNYPCWNTNVKEGTPCYKWYSISDDGGKTFSEPKPWQFDDGSPVYSSATYSRIIRASKNGKPYWIGNVTDDKSYGNFPRYPLNIVEIDENTGLAKLDTLTVIDTRKEGETERVQFSNFKIFEDRETLKIEICLSKVGQYNTGEDDVSKVFYGEGMLYEIEFD